MDIYITQDAYRYYIMCIKKDNRFLEKNDDQHIKANIKVTVITVTVIINKISHFRKGMEKNSSYIIM